VRIISGFLKNRLIAVPKSPVIRPTSAKLRAAVFNIMQAHIEGTHVLDLFCGSGAIGIEALSRGATSATFVDNDRQVLLNLKKTLLDLGISEQSTIIHKDVLKALRGPLLHNKQFSFIYIDPPYALIEPLADILQLIKENLSSNSGATIFLEVRKGSFVPPETTPLTIISKRTYSESDLWQFSTIANS
jgi:16S rRNA (guanine966-N2)-methyltransferase